MQVGKLMMSLNIDPRQLPSGPAATQEWDRLFSQGVQLLLSFPYPIMSYGGACDATNCCGCQDKTQWLVCNARHETCTPLKQPVHELAGVQSILMML